MNNIRNLIISFLCIMLFIIFTGCLEQSPDENTTTHIPISSNFQELRLATTTSTCDTGLLDVLNKKFEKINNVRILTICEGTGKAIATGELGAADVLIVHSEQAELKAVANGSFINRTYIMYNHFVILGPRSDPAGIRDSINAPDAFRKIAGNENIFVSRGDNSGTHLMELSIWKAANITRAGRWYQSIGKGMGETITTADIKYAYTLSDRGTYLALKDKIDLSILFESDQNYLYNPYHIMAVDPARFPKAKYDLAMRYIEFVTSRQGQDIIRNYGKDRYGEALFFPVID